MKLLDNISGFSAIAGAIFAAKDYKATIKSARDAGDFEKEREQILQALQMWSTSVVNYFKVDLNIINPENLPKEGPVVYICNHQSYADILTFIYVIKNHQIGFIAKDTLEKTPLFGYWIRTSRGIFIQRGDARASLQTINQGVEYLKNGFSLVIFPEGTRSRSSKIGEFKPGSFKLATKARVPIVPVTIDGGYRMFEERGAMTKGVHVDFMVHPPINTAELNRAELAEIPEKVEAQIRQGMEKILDEKGNSDNA